MPLEQWANDFADGGPTLTVAVSSTPAAGTSEAWTVSSTGTPLPATAPFRMRFDNEIVYVTAINSGVSLQVSRGLEGTIATHAIGTKGRVLVTAGALADMARPQDVQPLTLPDPLTIGTGTRAFVAPFAMTLLGFYGDAATGPVGSTAIFDVNLNGTTVFTTQANRPTFAAGTTTAAETVPDVVNVPAGGRITVDRDAVGTTTAAVGVTLFMRYRRAS